MNEKLREIIAESMALDLDQVTPESKFVEDLGCDSLDIVEITMCCEDEFEIEISDEQAEKATTVQEASDLIEKLVAKKGKR